MLVRLRKYPALDRRRRQLLWRAWMALAATRIALTRSSLKQLTCAFARLQASDKAPELEGSAVTLAREIGWAVRAAAAITPWRSSCLVQALAAQRMLQRRGIPGVFYIGAARGERGGLSSGLDAHAWLECGSELITGESGRDRYSVLSAFGWPAGRGAGQDH